MVADRELFSRRFRQKTQIFRAGTDCTKRYFENKDVEISYLNEIWAAY